MQLTKLHDQQLLKTIKDLVQSEREILTKVLHHLREIERRRLFSDLGYQSLFEYAVKELKYSESAASRRINAMRLMREIPEVEKSIAKGELSLSNVSQAQSFFRSKAKQSPDASLPKSVKVEVLNSLKNKSTREGEKVLLDFAPPSIDPKTFERERVVTPEASEVRFLLNDELRVKLEEVKALLGPKATGMGYAELFAEMAELSKQKLAEKKFGKKRVAATAKKLVSTPKERSTSSATIMTPAPASDSHVKTITSKNARYIPKAIAHAVWLRDKGRCQRCGSQHNINIDHIRPVACGGKATGENLRLLCFSCNQRQAIKSFGMAVISRACENRESS